MGQAQEILGKLRRPSARKRKLPVTVLSDFLGAGTTTLFNHVLNNHQDLLKEVAALARENL